jgi:hypothetical protein
MEKDGLPTKPLALVTKTLKSKLIVLAQVIESEVLI